MTIQSMILTIVVTLGAIGFAMCVAHRLSKCIRVKNMTTQGRLGLSFIVGALISLALFAVLLVITK